jgi:hypothetical protein
VQWTTTKAVFSWPRFTARKSVSVRVLGPDLPPQIRPEIVDFGDSNGPNRAPIPFKQSGCDVPHLPGWVGKSTGPIGPRNLTHQNSKLYISVGIELCLIVHPRGWTVPPVLGLRIRAKIQPRRAGIRLKKAKDSRWICRHMMAGAAGRGGWGIFSIIRAQKSTQT